MPPPIVLDDEKIKKLDWAFDAFHDFQGSRVAGLTAINAILNLPIYLNPINGKFASLSDIRDKAGNSGNYRKCVAAEEGDQKFVEHHKGFTLIEGDRQDNFRGVLPNADGKTNIAISVPVTVFDDEPSYFMRICDYARQFSHKIGKYTATWDVVPPIEGITKLCSGNVIFDSMTALNESREYVQTTGVKGTSIYGDYTMYSGRGINDSHTIVLNLVTGDERNITIKEITINYGTLSSSPSLLNLACLMQHLYEMANKNYNIQIPAEKFGTVTSNERLSQIHAIFGRRSTVKEGTIPKISETVVKTFQRKIAALNEIIKDLEEERKKVPEKFRRERTREIEFARIDKRLSISNEELEELHNKMNQYVGTTGFIASSIPVVGTIGGLTGAALAGVATVAFAAPATAAAIPTALIGLGASYASIQAAVQLSAKSYIEKIKSESVGDTIELDDMVLDSSEEKTEMVNLLDKIRFRNIDTQTAAANTSRTDARAARARARDVAREVARLSKDVSDSSRKKLRDGNIKENLDKIKGANNFIYRTLHSDGREELDGYLGQAGGSKQPKQSGGALIDSFTTEMNWLIGLIIGHRLTYEEAFKLLLFIKGVGDDSYSGINKALDCDAHFTGDLIGAYCAFKHGVPVVVLKHKVGGVLCYTIYIKTAGTMATKESKKLRGGLRQIGGADYDPDSLLLSAKLTSMTRVAPNIYSILGIDSLFERYRDLIELPSAKYYNACVLLLKVFVLQSYTTFAKISKMLPPRNYLLPNPFANELAEYAQPLLDSVNLRFYSTDTDIMKCLDLQVINEDGLLLDNTYFRLPLNKLFFELQHTLRAFDKDPSLGLFNYYIDEFLINNSYEHDNHVRAFAQLLHDPAIHTRFNAELNLIKDNLSNLAGVRVDPMLSFLVHNPAMDTVLDGLRQLNTYDARGTEMKTNTMPLNTRQLISAYGGAKRSKTRKNRRPVSQMQKQKQKQRQTRTKRT
jgi:hypothetical protein